MTAPIDGEWAVELIERGVDSHELEKRWEAIENLHGPEEELRDAAEELRDALALGIEGHDSRVHEAAAQASFEQALAKFREVARAAQRYVAGV